MASKQTETGYWKRIVGTKFSCLEMEEQAYVRQLMRQGTAEIVDGIVRETPAAYRVARRSSESFWDGIVGHEVKSLEMEKQALVQQCLRQGLAQIIDGVVCETEMGRAARRQNGEVA